MTALWIILALTVGAIAGALWRREQTADALAMIVVLRAEIRRLRKALPVDHYADLMAQAEIEMVAALIPEIDPAADAAIAETWGQRR